MVSRCRRQPVPTLEGRHPSHFQERPRHSCSPNSRSSAIGLPAWAGRKRCGPGDLHLFRSEFVPHAGSSLNDIDTPTSVNSNLSMEGGGTGALAWRWWGLAIWEQFAKVLFWIASRCFCWTLIWWSCSRAPLWGSASVWIVFQPKRLWKSMQIVFVSGFNASTHGGLSTQGTNPNTIQLILHLTRWLILMLMVWLFVVSQCHWTPF